MLESTGQGVGGEKTERLREKGGGEGEETFRVLIRVSMSGCVCTCV